MLARLSGGGAIGSMDEPNHMCSIVSVWLCYHLKSVVTFTDEATNLRRRWLRMLPEEGKYCSLIRFLLNAVGNFFFLMES